MATALPHLQLQRAVRTAEETLRRFLDAHLDAAEFQRQLEHSGDELPNYVQRSMLFPQSAFRFADCDATHLKFVAEKAKKFNLLNINNKQARALEIFRKARNFLSHQVERKNVRELRSRRTECDKYVGEVKGALKIFQNPGDYERSLNAIVAPSTAAEENELTPGNDATIDATWGDRGEGAVGVSVKGTETKIVAPLEESAAESKSRSFNLKRVTDGKQHEIVEEGGRKFAILDLAPSTVERETILGNQKITVEAKMKIPTSPVRLEVCGSDAASDDDGDDEKLRLTVNTMTKDNAIGVDAQVACSSKQVRLVEAESGGVLQMQRLCEDDECSEELEVEEELEPDPIKSGKRFGKSNRRLTRKRKVVTTKANVEMRGKRTKKFGLLKMTYTIDYNLDGYPLHQAARDGNVQRIRDLCQTLDFGSVNAKDEKGNTALHLATIEGKKKSFDELLRLGAKVDVKNAEGQTCLMIAASTGDEATLDSLLDAGAGLDFVDHDQKTALLLAIEGGYAEVARRLCDRKADVNFHEGDVCCLRKALEACGDSGADFEPVVAALLEGGYDVDWTNKSGLSTLEWSRKTERLRWLPEKFRSMMEAVTKRELDFLQAASEGNESFVREYLKQKGDVNARGTENETALILACERQDERMVKSLLEHGANHSLRRRDGKGSIEIGRETDNHAIVWMLCEKSKDDPRIIIEASSPKISLDLIEHITIPAVNPFLSDRFPVGEGFVVAFVGSKILIWGGRQLSRLDGTIVFLRPDFIHAADHNDLTRWSHVRASGDIPPPTANSAVVVFGDLVYIYGGQTPLGRSNEIYSLSVDGNFAKLSVDLLSPLPGQICWAEGWIHGGRLCFLRANLGENPEVAEFDPDENTFRVLPTKGTPPGLKPTMDCHPSLAKLRNELFCGNPLGSGQWHSLNLETLEWTIVSAGLLKSCADLTVSAISESEVLIVGGKGSNQVWVFDVENRRARRRRNIKQRACKEGEYYKHSAVSLWIDGKVPKVICFGGYRKATRHAEHVLQFYVS